MACLHFCMHRLKEWEQVSEHTQVNVNNTHRVTKSPFNNFAAMDNPCWVLKMGL